LELNAVGPNACSGYDALAGQCHAVNGSYFGHSLQSANRQCKIKTSSPLIRLIAKRSAMADNCMIAILDATGIPSFVPTSSSNLRRRPEANNGLGFNYSCNTFTNTVYTNLY
jgi:hypothetical protein